MRRVLAPVLGTLGLIVSPGPSTAATISVTYYEDQISRNCNDPSNNGICTLSFPLSSAITGKLLNVQRIGCYGSTSGRLTLGHFRITDGPGINVRREHPLDKVNLSNEVGEEDTHFSFADDVRLKVTGGPPRNVEVVLEFRPIANGGTPTASVLCSMVGEISNQ